MCVPHPGLLLDYATLHTHSYPYCLKNLAEVIPDIKVHGRVCRKAWNACRIYLISAVKLCSRTRHIIPHANFGSI